MWPPMASDSNDMWAFFWGLSGIIFHFRIVFRNNFSHGGFVRLTMFILQITFTPCASVCLSLMMVYLSLHQPPQWSKVAMTCLCLAAYPLSVPYLQYRTLSSAQRGAIGQIMWWPGQKEAPPAGESEQQYGSLYLRQQVKVDPDLVELFGEENVAMMPKYKGFSLATLPYYWEVSLFDQNVNPSQYLSLFPSLSRKPSCLSRQLQLHLIHQPHLQPKP